MNIPENFDRWMFDYQEGNLSGAEKEAFESFLIQNPEFEVEADAWNNSFIQNEQFVFPGAGQLEKDNRIVGGWYGYAAAAVLLLLIGSSLVFFTRTQNEINGFSADHSVNGTEMNEGHSNATLSANENYSALEDVLSNAVSENGSVNVNLQNNQNNNANNSNNNLANNEPNNGNGSNGLALNNNQSNNGNMLSNNNNSVQNDPNHTMLSNTNSNDISLSANQVNDPSDFRRSMDQELAKYDTDENIGKYQDNPDDSELGFDVAKINKGDIWKGRKMKNFWNKIEKMFDYPVGLTNLRDPDYLLPNNSIVASNPAFAGGMLKPRTELNYRNQWLGNEHNSQEMTLSIDNYFRQMRGGVGIVFNAKDYNYGSFGDYNVSLVYSPKIAITQNVLFEPAVKLTLGALTANGNKLAPDAGFELGRGRILNTPAAQQMNGNQTLFYKDYGLGFVINTKWFYAGFSADNLNRHYENVYNEEGFGTPTSSPVLLNGIAGFDYESLDKKMSISPFVAYQKYGDRQELWAGTSCRINKFIIGGSGGYDVSSKNFGYTAMIGMKFPKFKLAYQYDQTKTLGNEFIGSHNLTLRFNGKAKRIK